MTKRKHNQSRSKASPTPEKPAPRGQVWMIWTFVAVVAVVNIALFLRSPGPTSSAVPGIVPETNVASAAAPPAPAPEAPLVPLAAPGTNVALAQPPVENIDTNSVSDMLNLGNWLLEQNRVDEAEKAYRRAVEINADDEDAHFNLAIALTRQQRYEEAIKEYETTLAIFPDYLEAQNNIANALIKLGRNQEAMKYLEEALQLNPDYVQGLNNLGRLHAINKEWGQGHRAFRAGAKARSPRLRSAV